MATDEALLLDTHTFLWASFAPKRLSKNAKEWLTKRDTILWLSVASIWEIEVKHRGGQLQADARVVDASMRNLSVRALPIGVEHVRALAALSFGLNSCPDPFDRLIAVQAMVEKLPLVTKDEAFRGFDGVEVRW